MATILPYQESFGKLQSFKWIQVAFIRGVRLSVNIFQFSDIYIPKYPIPDLFHQALFTLETCNMLDNKPTLYH